MIRIKIDVTKIDKKNLYKGEKGIYLEAILIPTPDNQFGNSHMIVQSVSEQERKAGIKGAILGNAQTIEKKKQEIDDDDLPF